MCGISALIQNDDQRDETVMPKFTKAFQSIQYRGPDHTSTVSLTGHNKSVFLGFHRLAIIDPTSKSDELLQDRPEGKDQNVYLTCNGEIYNYQYLIKKYSLLVKTGSDCEVILQLYRQYPQLWPEIIEEFDGDFAFILYDANLGICLAARDRMGVRPLFHAHSKNNVAFGSEGKAVPFVNVRQFPPGHWVKFSQFEKYQPESWVMHRPYFRINYESAQVVIRELFTEAVRKRLMSDRPIGFLVSGGLDSSLVAAVAAKLLNKRITTFSIGLPGSPDLAAAAIVAKSINSDHHEIIISTADILEALPAVVRHCETYDITTIRASIPMYLISKYIKEHTDTKVIFSGEGADELLGGYLYFHKAPSYQAFQTETVRLLKELYKYDVLRGDRTTAAWGLEIRVPFLDADFLTFVTNIDPGHKMPKIPHGFVQRTNHGIEKALMREAFAGYLPESIINRQKEAFSDGVGTSSVAALKKWASEHPAPMVDIPGAATPQTDEARYYYQLFQEHYVEFRGLYPEYYWMPRWFDNVTDPSATVLSVYGTFCEKVLPKS